jgi:hypothetical protein
LLDVEISDVVHPSTTASVSQSELDLHVFDTAQYLRSRTLAVVVLVPSTMHVEDSESLDGDQTSFHSFEGTTAFTNACEFLWAKIRGKITCSCEEPSDQCRTWFG